MNTTPSDADKSADDLQKEKFKAALDAKKGKSGHAGESHTSTGSSGHAQPNRSGGKREFRRKSGG
ncbi:MAG: DUF5302 domain-containing protein [Actinobacteria bacterium]|nr:DUF5302 domain-containing protein [Actinomycetota bacterium]